MQVIYDKALFLTDGEYEKETGQQINVQAAVEMPHIRLLAMSGSTEEEQLRMVPDRAEGLHCVKRSLQRSAGEPIVDTIRGFTGDLQTRWHEAGLQKGGKYRCGVGCGCPTSLLPNYASNFEHIPSYQDLRASATAGLYGKHTGKNLHGLSAAHIRIELQKRGARHADTMDKEKLMKYLRNILKGVQRVPALLAFSPQAELSSLALESYEIWPCEPLHDLKGHVVHVLTDLPHHTDQHTAGIISNIVLATVNTNHSRGCDWRKALFLVTKALEDDVECSVRTS